MKKMTISDLAAMMITHSPNNVPQYAPIDAQEAARILSMLDSADPRVPDNIGPDEFAAAWNDYLDNHDPDEGPALTLETLIRNWAENDSTGDFAGRKITLEEAADLVSYIDRDVLDALGEDVTPEQFMAVWNEVN